MRRQIMKKWFLAFALATIAATPALASDTWKITQGTRGEVNGVWNVIDKGEEIVGSAKMSGPAGNVAYNIAGRLRNGVYTLTASGSSDNRNCRFQGEKKPDGSIVGSAICGGEQGPWLAHPTTN
jgi:hypothetical protein